MAAFESRTSLAKPSGTAVHVDFAYPSRGVITKVVVRQESGSDGFTVDVFNKNPDDFAAAHPEELFKICPSITGSSGVASYFPDGPRTFYNMDTRAYSTNARMLYVRVTGAATGTFHIIIGSDAELG